MPGGDGMIATYGSGLESSHPNEEDPVLVAGFGEPPDQGEPVGDGLDNGRNGGRTSAALMRLSERTAVLERTVSSLTEDVRHLPTKTTSMWALSIMVAMIALLVGAYWIGITGRFEGINGQFAATNAKIDGTNTRLDNLTKQVDRLAISPQFVPAASPAPHHHR
jgi:hypothetical protein